MTPTEHLARVILAELQRQDDGAWIDPRLTDDGVLMSNADAPSLGYVFLDGGFDLLALAEAVQRGMWQPIKTAPHGAEVLLYCPDRGITNRERVEVATASSGWSDHGVSTMSFHPWATHWMPLPPAPETKP